eukprot:5552639-Amphidinium_carterae.1
MTFTACYLLNGALVPRVRPLFLLTTSSLWTISVVPFGVSQLASEVAADTRTDPLAKRKQSP